MINVSVIIPLYKTDESIKFLIYSLINQTYKPKEIIILNSGENLIDIKKTINFFKNLTEIKFQIFNVIKLYPGEARNVGIRKSSCNYISFLDAKSFPKKNWLKDYVEYIKKTNSHIIFGKRITHADSNFKKLIKFSTYGNKSYIAVTGSLLIKDELINKVGFFSNVRAGEDVEWVRKIKDNKEILYYVPDKIYIIYNGLFNNYLQTLKKWFSYSLAYSKLNNDINHQKKISFFVFTYFIFLSFDFISNELNNFTLLHIKYLPIYCYFIFNCFVNPIFNKVKLFELFPFNWLIIGILRFSLDIIKFPGLFLGFFKIIFNNLLFKAKAKNE